MRRVLLILVPAFIILVPLEAFFQHLSFRTYAWDLGIYHQSLSRLSEFDEVNPFLWAYQYRVFNDHFDPIRLLVAPLFLIWDNAILMILIDLIAALAGLLPFILMVERLVKNRTTESSKFLLRFATVFGYLFCDFLWKALFSPSHPTQWAMAFLAWTLYFYEIRRFGAGFWLNLVLFFMCKEEFPFVGLMFGGVLALKKLWRQVILVFAMSIVFLIFIFMIRPLIWGDIAAHADFMRLLLSHPTNYFHRWVSVISDYSVFLPIFLIYFSLAPTAWRNSWDLALMMSAPFLIRLLSLNAMAFGHQYMAVFVPFIIAGFLRSVEHQQKTDASIKKIAWRLIIVTILGLALRQEPFHRPFNRARYYLKHTSEMKSREAVVRSLSDPDLKISMPDNWLPHLSDHKSGAMHFFWIEKNNPEDVDVWIWDKASEYYPYEFSVTEFQEIALNSLSDSTSLRKVRINKEVELWVRSRLQFKSEDWGTKLPDRG